MGNQGPQGPSGAGLTWRGEFACSATYAASDVISYQGSSWITDIVVGGCVTPPFAPWKLLAANGAFRASQGSTDRTDTLRRLDGAVKSYAEALKANSQQVDAAYNFEYAVRVRDAIGRSKAGAAAKNAALKKAANEPSDLPAGPTLHGRPGAPPSKTEMSQFKIVIPKRGEERKDNPEAGKGGTKIRKG